MLGYRRGFNLWGGCDVVVGVFWAGSYYGQGVIMGRGVFRAGLALAFSVIQPFF